MKLWLRENKDDSVMLMTESGEPLYKFDNMNEAKMSIQDWYLRSYDDYMDDYCDLEILNIPANIN